MLNQNYNCFPMNQMNIPINFQQSFNQVNQMQNPMAFDQMNINNNIINNFNQMPLMNNIFPNQMNQIDVNINNVLKKVYNNLELHFEHNHVIKNELTVLEYYLYRFFKLIEINDGKSEIMYIINNSNLNKNKKGTKLYINYYNIIKSVIYVDLNLGINDLIENIIKQIFCPFIGNNISECFYNYLNFLYLEYKETNLSKILGISFIKLDLKEGDELSLKLCDELFNEINTFPKDNTIHFKLNGVFIGHFTPKKGGLSKNIINILINNYLYFRNSSISETVLPGNSIDYVKRQTVIAGIKNIIENNK